MNDSARGPNPGLLSGLMDRGLASVERVGNRLPDPITLFVVFMMLVLGIQRILTEMPRTFTDFPPLGLVLVVMLGIGAAERTGLVETALSAFLGGTPGWLVTAAIVLAGLLSSVAVDAGVLIPLGAVIFHGMGRHPIAGLAAAFAGVCGGFSANLSLTALDPLLAGFTQPAAHLVHEAYVVDPTANWWLMIALVPVFVVAGTLVTERVLEPRIGTYTGTVREVEGDGERADPDAPLTVVQKRGLAWAAASLSACLAAIVWMALPEPGILRGPDGEITPLLSSIVALMVFVFFIPGLVYGLATGSIRSDKDVARMTSDTMASMGAYIDPSAMQPLSRRRWCVHSAACSGSPTGRR